MRKKSTRGRRRNAAEDETKDLRGGKKGAKGKVKGNSCSCAGPVCKVQGEKVGQHCSKHKAIAGKEGSSAPKRKKMMLEKGKAEGKNKTKVSGYRLNYAWRRAVIVLHSRRSSDRHARRGRSSRRSCTRSRGRAKSKLGHEDIDDACEDSDTHDHSNGDGGLGAVRQT
jgi:hypothetical protein